MAVYATQSMDTQTNKGGYSYSFNFKQLQSYCWESLIHSQLTHHMYITSIYCTCISS